MGAKLCVYLTVLLLASGTALANVYKCQTPDGIRYTESPCIAGSALNTFEPPPAPVRPQPLAPRTVPRYFLVVPPASVRPQAETAQSKESVPKSQAAVIDVNAMPQPLPQRQRNIYQEFLARPSPRAFAICKNGTITIVGMADFVKKQMSDIQYGCRLYAVNDEVVW